MISFRISDVRLDVCSILCIWKCIFSILCIWKKIVYFFSAYFNVRLKLPWPNLCYLRIFSIGSRQKVKTKPCSCMFRISNPTRSTIGIDRNLNRKKVDCSFHRFVEWKTRQMCIFTLLPIRPWKKQVPETGS